MHVSVQKIIGELQPAGLRKVIGHDVDLHKQLLGTIPPTLGQDASVKKTTLAELNVVYTRIPFLKWCVPVIERTKFTTRRDESTT